MNSHTILIGAVFLLTSCARAPRPLPHVMYMCGRVRFDVVFRGDTALITGQDGALHLPLAISGSGARYSDGEHTFWEHQGTARIELPDTTYEECRQPKDLAPTRIERDTA